PCRAAKHARRSEGLDWNLGQLINDWLKRRWRNWLAFGSSSLHPGGFGSENFRQSLFRTFAESGAVGKIGNVRNVAAVFFAVENVDVVVFHSSPPKERLYRSTVDLKSTRRREQSSLRQRALCSPCPQPRQAWLGTRLSLKSCVQRLLGSPTIPPFSQTRHDHESESPSLRQGR